jgi:hypothetical protein
MRQTSTLFASGYKFRVVTVFNLGDENDVRLSSGKFDHRDVASYVKSFGLRETMNVCGASGRERWQRGLIPVRAKAYVDKVRSRLLNEGFTLVGEVCRD